MKQTREFAQASRYLYDFGLCSTQNGWAQFDTAQDASYYGNWLNPFRRMFFTYCEGDTTLTECETDDEFRAYVQEVADWHARNDENRPRIDPGFNDELKSELERVGLSSLL